MMGKALNEIMNRRKDLNAMDLDGDVTGTAARQAFNAINYLKLVTSRDDGAQRALDDISQYIIHIEHKWLGRKGYDGDKNQKSRKNTGY